MSVLFISVVSPGYASPAVDFALHRASLALPIITGITIWYISVLELGSAWLILPLFCVGLYSANNSIIIAKSDYNSRLNNPRYLLLKAIKDLQDSNKPGEISKILFQEKSLGNEFLSVMATDEYFKILTFYRAVETCVIDEKYKDEDFLLLKSKNSNFCQEYKTIKCFDFEISQKPNMELCQMTQNDVTVIKEPSNL